MRRARDNRLIAARPREIRRFNPVLSRGGGKRRGEEEANRAFARPFVPSPPARADWRSVDEISSVAVHRIASPRAVRLL